MQKARRHPEGLRPLVSAWFQVLFTPLFEVLFTFPSRYWFTIGLSGVFSLTGWCRQLQTGFLRPRPTQDPSPPNDPSQYGALTLSGRLSQVVLIRVVRFNERSYYPERAVTPSVWAVPSSLATTNGITLVFSSSGY